MRGNRPQQATDDGASRPSITYTVRMRILAVAVFLVSSLASYGPAAAQPAPGRALVLEPFATQLSSDGLTGANEAAVLRQAGFAVTILTGSQVTVPVMMHLTDYNVIYIETHSAILPNGDAVISTGETNNRPYSALYGDGGLLQTVVAGDPHHALYNAVTGRFFALHLGTFAPGAILFVNGCAALSAPLLWQDLKGRGLSTLIGWNGDVPEQAATVVGDAVMSQLGAGKTVAESIEAGAAAYPSDLSSLGFHYDGNGEETLGNALTASPPALPTPAPTIVVPRPFVPHFPRWKHVARTLFP
jgi:hypothetical protein